MPKSLQKIFFSIGSTSSNRNMSIELIQIIRILTRVKARLVHAYFAHSCCVVLGIILSALMKYQEIATIPQLTAGGSKLAEMATPT